MGYDCLHVGYVKRTICVRFILLFLLSYVDMVVWILEGGNDDSKLVKEPTLYMS